MFLHTIRLIASFVACHWQQSNGIIIKSYSLFRPLILPRRRCPSSSTLFITPTFASTQCRGSWRLGGTSNSRLLRLIQTSPPRPAPSCCCLNGLDFGSVGPPVASHTSMFSHKGNTPAFSPLPFHVWWEFCLKESIGEVREPKVGGNTIWQWYLLIHNSFPGHRGFVRTIFPGLPGWVTS